MTWGHDFLRIREGGIFKPSGPMGKSQMSKGKHIKILNCPFLVFFPNHLFLPEEVEVVITWECEEYGKILNLEEHPFLKNMF